MSVAKTGDVEVEATPVEGGGKAYPAAPEGFVPEGLNEVNPKATQFHDAIAAGWTQNVRTLIDDEQYPFSKDLVAGEYVVSCFHVFVPSFRMPWWKFILLSIITVGIYAAFYMIRKWCWRIRCCTPAKIEMSRAQMAITNMGRVMLWKLEVSQQKTKGLFEAMCCCLKICCRELCAAPVVYAVSSSYYCYNVTDIVQTTVAMTSEALCWPLTCCPQQNASVVASFGAFNMETGLANVRPVTGMGISAAVAADTYSTIRTGVLRFAKFLDVHEEGFDVKIISEVDDENHRWMPMETHDQVFNLHAKIRSFLPNNRDKFVDPGTAMDQGPVQLMDSVADYQIIGDDGSVQVPRQWMAMQQGEHIIKGQGFTYVITFYDWYLSVVTLGLYYCLVVRARRFQRWAVLLTNKRIVTLVLTQRAGKVPNDFTRYRVRVCSFCTPEEVASGFVKRHTGLCFRDSAAAGVKFGKVNGLILSYEGLRTDDFMKVAMALTYTSSRQSPLDVPGSEPGAPLEDEASLLPLMQGEQVLARSLQGEFYVPCCKVVDGAAAAQRSRALGELCPSPWWACSIKDCVGEEDDDATEDVKDVYLCARNTLACCFPGLPAIFSCGARPLTAKSKVIITTTTVYSIRRETNYKDPPMQCCAVDNTFVIVWAPVRTIQGNSTHILTWGSEDCMRRLCAGTFIGDWCCNIAESEFGVDVRAEQELLLTAAGWRKGSTYAGDPDLDSTRSYFNHICRAVMEESKV